MSKKVLFALLFACLVIVSGCTSLMGNVGGTSQVSDNEVNNLFDDFEGSLMDENSDVELGSII